MPLIRLGSVTVSYRVAVTIGLCLLLGGQVVAGEIGQARTVADGVYSNAQAERGHALYEVQCASCHGDTLEGLVGPPLVGEGFLSVWSARPLVDLVDKIQKTMPLDAPEPLARSQAIELTAHLLLEGAFPTGAADLNETTLTQVTFPEVPTALPGALPAYAPVANLAQLMRSIAFPNSNVIFNVQIKDPGAQSPAAPGTRSFDYVEWGTTVYPGWEAVDLAALALIDSTPLFLTPGRRCENGRPVPVERADWKQYTEALIEVSRDAYRASQSRSVDAMIAITEELDAACANCHQVYRDVGVEGRGSGADRCRENP